MRHIYWIFILFINIRLCSAQSDITNNIVATRGNLNLLNFNSNKYYRIFDGFLLDSNEKTPSLPINDIVKSNDSAKLKKFGLHDFNKPYQIMNSYSSLDTRNYINRKINANIGLMGMNLPVAINKILITPDKYSILSNLDTNKIITVKYKKDIPNYLFDKKSKLPFGIIEVVTKE